MVISLAIAQLTVVVLILDGRGEAKRVAVVVDALMRLLVNSSGEVEIDTGGIPTTIFGACINE